MITSLQMVWIRIQYKKSKSKAKKNHRPDGNLFTIALVINKMFIIPHLLHNNGDDGASKDEKFHQVMNKLIILYFLNIQNLIAFLKHNLCLNVTSIT